MGEVSPVSTQKDGDRFLAKFGLNKGSHPRLTVRLIY